MPFDITRYLGKPLQRIGNSQEIYQCPSCNKTIKVNISLPTKPYKCWSGGCSSDMIRKALGLVYIPNTITKTPQAYNISPTKLIGTEVPQILTNYQPNYKSWIDTRDNKQARITHYYYSDTHRVERIDYFDGSKKKFIPSYIFEGKRKYGSSLDFPLFNVGLLNKTNKPLLYLLEGEKCAITFTKHLGLLSVTPPGFGWDEKYLKPQFQKLSSRISGLLLIPDNDETGIRKMKFVQTIAWTCGISCNVLSVKKLPYSNEKEDVADLINKNIEIKHLLC